MPSKAESRLWYQLRDATNNLHNEYPILWTRIESWAAPGVPDLHGLIRGKSFWLELKVHKLKSLKSVKFRPHQISWQTKYSMHGGLVWNLVGHPPSRSINLFSGEQVMGLAGMDVDKAPLTPVWSSGAPFNWSGLFNHLLSSSMDLPIEET